ncbi:hypothetical protein ACFLQ8_03630, partial [Candidatus Auribacterota bacterium]
SSKTTKLQYLEFFKNLPYPSALIQRVVCDDWAFEKDTLVVDKIKDVIAEWVNRSVTMADIGAIESGRI